MYMILSTASFFAPRHLRPFTHEEFSLCLRFAKICYVQLEYKKNSRLKFAL